MAISVSKMYELARELAHYCEPGSYNTLIVHRFAGEEPAVNQHFQPDGGHFHRLYPNGKFGEKVITPLRLAEHITSLPTSGYTWWLAEGFAAPPLPPPPLPR